MTTTHTHTAHTHTAADVRHSPARRFVTALWRRWPALSGVALFLAVGGGGSAGELAPALMLLPTAYLLALAAGDRRWTWPLVVVVLGGYVGLELVAVVDPRVALSVLAVAALGAAVLRRCDPHEVLLQGVGLLGFGAAAFGASVVSPHTAVWLVAGAWFAHGLWDLLHVYRDAVVARSFAEWCGVIDVLTAVAIVVTATSWAL